MKLLFSFLSLKSKFYERLPLHFAESEFAILFLFILFINPISLCAQTVKLEGLIKDTNGEKLPLAHILILPDSTILPADLNGNFSMKVLPGLKNITITYTGYEILRSAVDVRHDTTITFSLSPRVGQLEEITVTANHYSQKRLVESTATGMTTLTKKDINNIPVLGGEADVIKTLQLLPGMTRGVEGSSDLFVRGGAADQNLVLLDGAPIYNTGHLFGFFSVFNPDILETVEAINGGFPAEFGGRLSSVLNITTDSSIAERTHISGNIGLIASRLHIEQPLIKDKASIWVAGRRTYIDQVVQLIGEKLPYYFYDLNGKIIFKPNKHDQVEFSYYAGEDILKFSVDENDERYGFTSTYTSGNTSQSLQWRHHHWREWISDLAFTRTAYQYNISNILHEDELMALSHIVDLGAKYSLKKDSIWRDANLKAGIEWTRHTVSPNIINSTGFFTELLESSTITGKVIHEMAAHIQQEWSPLSKLLINMGLRGSLTLVTDNHYFTPEPRISLRYATGENQALKLSYSRMAQYMHRISNSAISTPVDVWYPVTDNIRPQRSHQLASAWQKFLPKQKIFISAEGYYKTMENLIGYEEGTNLFFNPNFESKLIQGKGRTYGFEFLLRKEAGRLTGWLSYTLSWTWRQYNEINKGDWFLSRYDRRHNGALVIQYNFLKRWTASMVWEYISGSRFTPIIGQYIGLSPTLTGVDLLPIYSSINEVKLADTHRLDLGIKFTSKAGRKFAWHLFAGVNNAYNRASPVGIVIEQDKTDGSLRYSQPGLFGLLPFINYGFRF